MRIYLILAATFAALASFGCLATRSDLEKLGAELRHRDFEIDQRVSSNVSWLSRVDKATSGNLRTIQSVSSTHTRDVATIRLSNGSLERRVAVLSSDMASGDKGLDKRIDAESRERSGQATRMADAMSAQDGKVTHLQLRMLDMLKVERDILVSLIEAKDAIEDLKRRGVLTEEEVKASKAVKLEAHALVKHVERLGELIKAMEAAMEAPQAARE